MTIEERLKALILERYSSIREFTIQTDIPYSTLDSILKRGIDKAGIVTVVKICKALRISADKLAEGEIVSTTNLCIAPNHGTEIVDILDDTKAQLLYHTDLTLNGQPVDIEIKTAITQGIDVALAMAKSLNKNHNKNN